MGDAVDVNGPKTNVSHAGAVAQDEPVLGADNESEVHGEDRKNHTAKDDDDDGIFDNESYSHSSRRTSPTDESRGTADHPPLMERQPTPKRALDDILVEAAFTSDMATAGWSATFSADSYRNKAATRNMTKTITAAKGKAKKDQPMPLEHAYTRDPRLKKLKPTDPDIRAVNNELVLRGQGVSKCKTPIKMSDGVEVASVEASAKAQVKIAQMKKQHNLELVKLHLQNKCQMAKDKIKANQQSAWYKSIQPAGTDSANRAVWMGGASEQPWYTKPLRLLFSPSTPHQD
ncbi:hypothetical protein BDK51DRAFT_42183 [Blyttiomyces helicus]|uniref:Uncharacterized protein n=1 Tax=Blyttiomyces helicus TaxID=388810 RepID=A0A4V1IQW7_9FUNG|nr:hypothetical protein BDK51DRAFT_42183 [Blyttiomyces helicus]|eukprot:RKO87997.1 hypothetical protein BDK51DRAFT_42183 [Blyttiomyces helicus]